MKMEQSEGALANAGEPELVSAANVIDLESARAGAEAEVSAARVTEQARADYDSNITSRIGGYTIWATRMGDGPVSYQGAKEYRAAWHEAQTQQRLAQTA